MHMMTKNSTNSETPNQYSFWSYCFALVSVFALADVISGGLVRESLVLHKVEYVVTLFAMIATVGVYASDGTPGARFIRSYSRHKL
ncbi:MAG: hypothetical protein H7281_07440 [Bacteriovorax sp.]|nr:hypothetical protein [Bacteriovorax sp.]